MAHLERSAGFVVFFCPAVDTPVEYLLLNYGRHWDFAKGHVETGEDDLTAARRELTEETGLTEPRIVKDFHEEMTYFFRHKRHGLVRKTVVYFLAEVDTRKVSISAEHTGYTFLPFDEAVKRLTFPSAKQILKRAAHRLAAIV